MSRLDADALVPLGDLLSLGARANSSSDSGIGGNGGGGGIVGALPAGRKVRVKLGAAGGPGYGRRMRGIPSLSTLDLTGNHLDQECAQVRGGAGAVGQWGSEAVEQWGQ